MRLLKPPADAVRRQRVATLAERHAWMRVLLHLAVLARYRRNARWHLRCIRREFYEHRAH
jgi:hypothetical protein